MSAELKIKKRNGAIVDFDEEKISLAVQKAFLDVLKEPHTDESKEIAATVHAGVVENYGGSSQIADVEAIQDSVERSLMGLGYFDVAKAYIIYRYEHEKIREEKKRNATAIFRARGEGSLARVRGCRSRPKARARRPEVLAAKKSARRADCSPAASPGERERGACV